MSRIGTPHVHRLGLAGIGLVGMWITSCGGTGGSSGPPQSSPHASPSPTATATLDPTALAHRYVMFLTTDLAPLRLIDADCTASVDVCGRALDEVGAIATKVGDDLQHTPAEPASIQAPVEGIRREARFVVLIDQDFRSGTMPASDAVRAYTAEYNAIEHYLSELKSP